VDLHVYLRACMSVFVRVSCIGERACVCVCGTKWPALPARETRHDIRVCPQAASLYVPE
jgi:hypothetical protein